MNKPKTYTVDNVLNASKIGFSVYFKSEKHLNYIMEDLSKILLSEIILTSKDKDVGNMPLLYCEYISNYNKYVLKIPQVYYTTYKERIKILIEYIDAYCVTDNMSRLEISLSYNHNIKTIYNIHNMDLVKYIFNIDNEYIKSKLGYVYNSYDNLSSPFIIPNKGIFIGGDTIIDVKCLSIDNKHYFSLNLEDIKYDIIKFNYIGGDKWAKNADNIIEIIEYYIIYTYQQLNVTDDDNKYHKQLIEYSNKIRNLINIIRIPTNKIDNNNLSIYVNMSQDVRIIKCVWSKIYNNIINLICNGEINGGEYNYESLLDRSQLRGTNITGCVLNNYDLVNCDVKNCVLINCRIFNTMITKSRIYNSLCSDSSKIYESYMNQCDINLGSVINNSYYINIKDSVFKGDANNSIIKFSDISNMSNIDKESVILNIKNNDELCFDINYTDEVDFYVN